MNPSIGLELSKNSYVRLPDPWHFGRCSGKVDDAGDEDGAVSRGGGGDEDGAGKVGGGDEDGAGPGGGSDEDGAGQQSMLRR